MKKILIVLMTALLVFSSIGSAAFADTFATDKVTAIVSGANGDFDGDTTNETVTLEANVNEYQDGEFTLTVNEQSFTVENCMSLDDTLYMMPLGNGEQAWGTLFMVSEYGPSDDHMSYCFMYMNGTLNYVGTIPALAKSMTFNGKTITTTIRSKYIGTWFRPADFTLASGFSVDEEGNYVSSYCLTEVPRDIYPMGMIVTLNVDLPLMASRFDSEPSRILGSNQKVILSASDDSAWLYVSALDGMTAGWIRMNHDDGYLSTFTIDGTEMSESEVFSDILYAD